MSDIFWKLLANCIPNKEKRRQFRRKHLAQIDIEKRLSMLETFFTEQMALMTGQISLNVQRAISVAHLHAQTFAPFKYKHVGQNVVLMGAGPTVRYFEPLKDARVYIGLNRACLFDKVHFDYLFSIDKVGLVGCEKEFFSYDCVKFIGDQNISKEYQIPENFGANDPSVKKYKTTHNYLPGYIAKDIDTAAIYNSASVSVQAMQFALFTSPAKIYLVGIDCTTASKQHFTGPTLDLKQLRNEDVACNDCAVISDWHRIKEFAEMYYPQTKIISVNPVGLKGLFEDIYTESYLKEHLDIEQGSVNIYH